MRFVAPVVVALALLASTPAAAADTPQQRLEADLARIRTTVEQARACVRAALDLGDWNRWSRAHDAYVSALMRAVPDVERSTTTFLLGVLRAGQTLDAAAMKRVDDAAALAGTFSRHRVLVGSYAALTRRGVRPDRRPAALRLLAKQGVYVIDGRPPGATAPRARRPRAEDNPLTGHVPGSGEAAEYLSRWQAAYLKEPEIRRALLHLEDEMTNPPSDADDREELEQRLAAARQAHEAVLAAIEEWRRKYYEAGGR